MLPDEKRKCHCTGFTRGCRGLVVSGECQGRWVQVQGKNPQTGEDASRWDCVDNLTPMLLLENTQQQRQTGAAIESMRNETTHRQDAQIAATVAVARGVQSRPRVGGNIGAAFAALFGGGESRRTPAIEHQPRALAARDIE